MHRWNLALEAFELNGTAVAILDGHGEVVKLNKSAKALLGGGVRISKKRLVSDDSKATSALDHAIQALLNKKGPSLQPPVFLPRVARRPLLAYPLILESMVADASADCKALLVLVDPEKRIYPSESVLRAGFGLTVAEARLASRLAGGEPIEDAADKLGVAKDTARNQLKSIFSKTGVHRQAELVALMASLVGPLF